MKKNLSRLKYVLPGLLLALAMWSCYPGGPENIAETDLVFTFYDQSADFGSIRTFFMPDKVFVREGSEETVDDFDGLILSDVARNMEALGYVRERDPQNNGADSVVIVSKVKSTYTSVGWVPGYPWYPGWGYPGWGWYGPWYPVGVSYSTGTVFVEFANADDVNVPEQQVVASWSGVINGILGSSSSATASRVTANIDQAFKQSPYLGR
jgi:hypothetical protein